MNLVFCLDFSVFCRAIPGKNTLRTRNSRKLYLVTTLPANTKYRVNAGFSQCPQPGIAKFAIREKPLPFQRPSFSHAALAYGTSHTQQSWMDQRGKSSHSSLETSLSHAPASPQRCVQTKRETEPEPVYAKPNRKLRRHWVTRYGASRCCHKENRKHQMLCETCEKRGKNLASQKAFESAICAIVAPQRRNLELIC